MDEDEQSFNINDYVNEHDSYSYTDEEELEDTFREQDELW